MKFVTILCCVCIIFQQTNLTNGFFGGFPGIPNINGPGQLGGCYLFGRICNANPISLRSIPPYNQPLLSAIVTALIIADPSLDTKNCDSLCRCLTGQGGSCARSFPFLNSNGCPILQFKCRCSSPYGAVQQAQAAVRLVSGKVCL